MRTTPYRGQTSNPMTPTDLSDDEGNNDLGLENEGSSLDKSDSEGKTGPSLMTSVDGGKSNLSRKT